MKKKLIMILAVLTMGIVGCTSNTIEVKEAQKIIEKAVNKTNESKSIAGNISMEMTIDYSDKEVESETTERTTKFKANKNEEDPNAAQLWMQAEMAVLDQKSKSTLHLKDNVVYYEIEGQKIKQTTNVSVEALMSEMKSQNFDSENMQSARKVSKNDNTLITVKLKTEVMKELVLSLLESQGQDTSMMSDDALDVRDVTLEYTIDKDGFVINEQMNYSFVLKSGDNTATVTMKSNIEFTSFKEQKIEYPDFSDFVEMQSQQSE